MQLIKPALTAAMLVSLLPLSLAVADDGTVTIKIHEAIARKKDNDDTFGPQQDFFVCSDIEYQGALISAAPIGDRDHASWVPPGTNFVVAPGKNKRFFDIYFELWDDDDSTEDDPFDISPQNGPVIPHQTPYVACSYENVVNGTYPHVTYDVCTGNLSVNGVNGSQAIEIGSNAAQLKGEPSSPGILGTWATLRFEVVRDPSNWLPDDVAVEKVEIVQSVKGALEAVADKDTALLITLSSTYPFWLQAPVIGTMTDGINSVADTKLVWVTPGTPAVPGETLVSLFDGENAPPFRPQKILGIGAGKVSATGQIDYIETISPNAPPQLQDCSNHNNVGKATDLPLKRTNDLHTVYARYDYDEDMNFMSFSQLQEMKLREDKLRLASWPLASLDSTLVGTQLHRDHGGNLPFIEPFSMVFYSSLGAQMAGIDRLVLSVRNGWFRDNEFRHQQISNGSIGYSLGWFAPHAVLAEDGFYGVSVHELGHTYNLSQHACNVGNFDEYAMTSQCGAPFQADGFDVTGTVFPGGFFSERSGLDCPARAAIPREVCTVNIMDSNPPVNPNSAVKYDNWIDAFTFHYLLDNAIPHTDPALVALGAIVHLPFGPGNGTSPPQIDGKFPAFAYQFTGIQDSEMAPLSFDGESFLGVGPYRVRFLTPLGLRDYRFAPRMMDSPTSLEQFGAIALNLPWDPATTEIQLLGPVDLRNQDCWNRYCPGDSTVLDSRVVSRFSPSTSDLRAGRDLPAPPTPPGGTPSTPLIGPGHDAVISWNQSDPDSPALRATLILTPQDAAGGSAGQPMPIAVDLIGGSLRVAHSQLADTSGLYTGRVLVSDGINTVEATQERLLNICNYTNGGVEICNGIDDNCDGIIDNATNPGPVQVQLNPQPFPPESDQISWPHDPLSQTHDVVYGDAITLQTSGGDFSLSTLDCLANDLASDSYGPLPTPPAGGALWFDVRGSNCIGAGTYDNGDAGQRGSRDAEINGSDRACP